MNKEEIFAQAKAAILGPRPEDAEIKIAYNMAENFLNSTIKDAEYALVGIYMPVGGLKIALEKAVTFHTDEAFQYFSEKTRSALGHYAANMQKRYEPLMQELSLKAA